MSLRRSLLLACALLVLAPTAASATVTVSRAGGTVLVQSSDAAGDVMTAGTQGTDVVVEALGAVAGAGCTAGSDEVACPASGVTAVRATLGAGDDEWDGSALALRQEVSGASGADALRGGAAGDVLDGGSGADELFGMGGNDRVLARDGERDGATSCGDGDDDLVVDGRDNLAMDCEVTAPILEGTLGWRPSVLRSWEPLVVDSGSVSIFAGTSATMDFTTGFRWFRCDTSGTACREFYDGQNLSIFLTDADVGSRFFVEMHTTNRAGSDSARTPVTPPIAQGQMPELPQLPQMPPLWFPPVPKEFPQSIANAIGYGSISGLAGTDPRTLARRTTWSFRFFSPIAGTYRFTLTLPAKAARKAGIRGGKAVTVAAGVLKTARSGEQVTATLTPTRNGRKALRTAKRLDLSLATTVQTIAQPAPFRVATKLTLKRR